MEWMIGQKKELWLMKVQEMLHSVRNIILNESKYICNYQ